MTTTRRKVPKTDAGIAKLGAVETNDLVPFGGSLYLKNRPNGRKSWVLRTRIGGKWRVRQLGDWPTVGLYLAKQRAEAGRTELARPDVDSSVQHALKTFQTEYLVNYRTADARKESAAMLTRALARLSNRALPSLRKLDLTNAVQALAETPNSALKTLALLKQFTGWATTRGLLEVDPLGGVTAKRLGLKPYAPRERVLSADELRALWQRTDPDAAVLRFCFLTACRIGEALQWTAAQVVDGVWTIPLTKNGKPHTVPLTPAAEALLPLPSPMPVYVSLAQRLKRGGATWTAHDLRRTAATAMSGAGVPEQDVEAVLNHAPPRLVQVYVHHDPLVAKSKALAALAAWTAETLDECSASVGATTELSPP